MQYIQLFAQQQGEKGFASYKELDLYESEPIKITKSVQSLEDPQAVTSSYSQTFRVPHTATNGQFFESVFNVNVLDFNATRKCDAYINIDGAYFISGNIRLQSIYRNDSRGKIEYEILFFGETTTFAAEVSPKDLSSLDLSEYGHDLTYTNVQSSWNNNLENGDIVYPLAEWGYTYDTSGVPEQSTLSVYTGGTGGSVKGFTNVANPLEINQFKPAIRAKAVWDKIFEEAGYSYTSDFLNSGWFQDIYMVSTNDAKPIYDVQTKALANLINQSIGTIGGGIGTPPQEIQYTSVTYDSANAFNLNNNKYLITANGLYDFTLNINTNYSSINYGSPFLAFGQMSMYVDDVLYSSFTTALSTQASGGPLLRYVGPGNLVTPKFEDIPLTIGQVVDFRFFASSTYFNWLWFSSGTVKVEGPNYVAPSGLLPTQYKQIDFIKGINDRFKLVWEPDVQNPKKFTITPWIDWIRAGEQKDWTDKLDEGKDITITPLFVEQPRQITFKDSEEGDFNNFNYQQQYKETFGQLNFDSNIELITGDKEIKTLFSSTPLSPIGLSNNFLIPHFAKDTETQRQPIQVKPRLLFYNGLQVAPRSWYMKDTVNGVPSTLQTQYPAFSSFDRYPYDENATDLNWNNSPQYWDAAFNLSGGTGGTGFSGRTASTAYTNYWQTWTDNMYSPYSRKMVATFKLNSEDIQNLRFNDRIFVKDSYWYPYKISDYVLGEVTPVTVELVKLNNVGAYLGPFSELYEFTNVCYSSSSSCNACCCRGTRTTSIWGNSPIFQQCSFFYNNQQGSILASQGWYSQGTYSANVGDTGNVTAIGLCSSCSCNPVTLYQITGICSSSTVCGICCSTGCTGSVWGNAPTFTASTQLYRDNLANPLTPNFWYGPTAGTPYRVGPDGYTVTQSGNCGSCSCVSLPSSGYYAIGLSSIGACCIEGVTGSTGSGATLMYQNQSTFLASNLFYYNAIGNQPVPSAGGTGFVSDGQYFKGITGPTAGAAVGTCNYVTNPCSNRNRNVQFISRNFATQQPSGTFTFNYRISFDGVITNFYRQETQSPFFQSNRTFGYASDSYAVWSVNFPYNFYSIIMRVFKNGTQIYASTRTNTPATFTSPFVGPIGTDSYIIYFDVYGPLSPS